MKEYDIVLVVGYFRTAASFLSVVRALAGRLRIAVLSVDADPRVHDKTGHARAVFFDFCKKCGADVLEVGESARATLTVVQQFSYGEDTAQTIRSNLRVKEYVGLMTLAMAGLEKHDAYLVQFGIRRVYVPSRRFMSFLIERRGGQSRYENISVVEVGLPFSKHPVFPEFAADWIIAAPTLFSFHSERGKQQFLSTVNSLLSKLPSSDVVVYKSHNGHSRDYFAPRLHYAIARVLGRIPAAGGFLQCLQRLPWPWLRLQALRVQTCILHRSIVRRAVPMAHLTPYAELSLEAFLPGVRKGVIGGLSNTIWGTLYFDLPFYNCVDESERRGQSELLKRRSDDLLDLNLQYFGVPFCNGDLTTDVRHLGIIETGEREGDLVAVIERDFTCARSLGEQQLDAG